MDTSNKSKRIVVVIGHAAHVQLFQHLIPLWQGRGWQVRVLARAKSLVRELLDARDIEYEVVSTPGGALGMAGELAKWWLWGTQTFLRWRPDIVLSVGGTFSAFPAWMARSKSVMLTDTEDATLGNKLALPFSHHVLTPEAYLHDLGGKQTRYPSYQEMAYAHPNRFSARNEVLKKYGLEKDRYAVVRFVKHTAGHDIGQEGLGDAGRVKLLERLQEEGLHIVLSSEDKNEVEERFKPLLQMIPSDDVLHVLAGARIYAGESPTMAMEAGALGTPSAWVSTRVGKLGYPIEMQERFGLVENFTQPAPFFEHLPYLLSDQAAEDWMQGKAKLADEREDLSEWLDAWVSAHS